MKAPKEIASKAERYKELKKEIDKLYEELEEFANENGFEDFWIDGFGVSQEPNGEEQTDGHWGGDVSGTKARCIAWQPLPEPYRRFKKELS